MRRCTGGWRGGAGDAFGAGLAGLGPDTGRCTGEWEAAQGESVGRLNSGPRSLFLGNKLSCCITIRVAEIVMKLFSPRCT